MDVTSNPTLWRVSLTTTIEAAPHFAELLEESALAVSFYETDEFEEWLVEATWENSPELSKIELAVNSLALALGVPSPFVESEPLKNQDWLAVNYQAFPPIEVGPFFIHGSHLSPSLDSNKIPLKIDAATAFGTGEHPTTWGCLQLLAQEDYTQITKAIDVGCGSGILAMAIAKIAQKSNQPLEVWACDNDPESVRVCQENLVENSLDLAVKALLSEGLHSSDLKGTLPFDLIVANILANPLCEMAFDLTSNLSPGGTIILSGLLNTQADMVAKAYTSLGLVLSQTLELKEWSVLRLCKTL